MPRPLIAWIAALLLSVTSACDSRVDSIREALSDADRERFDRGARASGECWTCHELYTNNHKIGPGLAGVFGRKTGGAEGFGYSDALSNAGFVWSDITMAAFLSDSQAVVPGNRMIYRGIRNPNELDAVVFYLRQVTQPDP